MDSSSSHSSHSSHHSSRGSLSQLTQESVTRINPMYDSNDQPQGIDNIGADHWSQHEQDRRSSRSSSSTSSSSSTERSPHPPSTKKSIFGFLSRRKNKPNDDVPPPTLHDEDTEGAVHVQNHLPLKDDPDPEVVAKRKWLICKTVILVVLLILCVIFFTVVLVVIKDKKFDDVDPVPTEVTYPPPPPMFEAVTVDVSMILGRPFHDDYNDTSTYQRLLLEREYTLAIKAIFSDTYLAEEIIFIHISEISADDSADDCTFIQSKLVLNRDLLVLNDTEVDVVTYLQLLSNALSQVTRNVEAILLADAARPYGEIRRLDVKPISIIIMPAAVELVPIPPTSPRMTTKATTTLASTTKPSPTKKATTTRRPPTTTRRPTTTTKAPTTTEQPTTTTQPTTTSPTTTSSPQTTTLPTTTFAVTTQEPPTITEGPCPPGIPEVNCFINPCDISFCYLNQDALCIPDYCGGCNANFYDRSTRTLVACWHACENGESPVQCLHDPCYQAECPINPQAFCQANNCGGCNAEFYDLPVGGNRVVCEDSIRPTIICPDDVYVPIPTWQAGTTVSYPPAVANDNYGIHSVEYSHESGGFFFEGETDVTVTVEDYGGNTAYCSFQVTVYFSTRPIATRPPTMRPGGTTREPPPPPTTTIGIPPIDTEAPIVPCPSDIEQFNDRGEDYATVYWNEPTSYDGSRFGIGETPVTMTATDDAGNSRTCTFTVTVVDNEPPLVLCPRLSPVLADPGQGTARVELPMTGTRSIDVRASDNSRFAPEVADYEVVQYFEIGESDVYITATDASGNVGSCKITITVYDNQLPTIRCPGHMTLFTFTNSPIQYLVPMPNAQDNSGDTDITLDIDFMPAEPNHFFQPSWHILTYFAKDESGNSADCSFQIQVKVIQAIYEGTATLTNPYLPSHEDVTSNTHITARNNFQLAVSAIFDGTAMSDIFAGVNVDRFTPSTTGVIPNAVAHFVIGFTDIPIDGATLEFDVEAALTAQIATLQAQMLEGSLRTS